MSPFCVTIPVFFFFRWWLFLSCRTGIIIEIRTVVGSHHTRLTSGIAAVSQRIPIVRSIFSAAVSQRVFESVPELFGHNTVQDGVDGCTHIICYTRDVGEGGVDHDGGWSLVDYVNCHQSLSVEGGPANEKCHHYSN
ncbi:hypothetical protein HNY73_004032 [Argiope bruennichi]|uniref:Uncharacterized protein n=1 Tax=Argiope bruennichi TaxID=94029 RepID=A0A8T0FSG4_ARGBR|nr:hypothetical protein HNY73_004032 [Argiope bruennichi]